METVPFEAGIGRLFGNAVADGPLRLTLREAEAELDALASDLAARRSDVRWRRTGLTVAAYPRNLRPRLAAYVEGGELTFSVELTPGDFYPDLGRDPSAYYVEADVYVEAESGQDCVDALPEVECAGAHAAVAGLLRTARDLRALAATVAPTADAWRAAARKRHVGGSP